MNNSENGPLRVITLNDQNHSFGVRDNNGFRCFLPKVHHYTGQDERHKKEVSDITAFAHLFAAAQTLLEELEETHAALCFTADYVGSLRYEKNKAAIEAAKEKQYEQDNHTLRTRSHRTELA